MNEIIERVARAAHKANYESGRQISPGFPDNPFERERWYFIARAAITAMREPTEAMLENDDDAGYVLGGNGVRDCYQAMIDAALVDKTGK